MKVILRIIEILLVLLGIATGLVFIFLGVPDWSPFQSTLVTTVIPIATMVAAWTTLLVAYAAFRAIQNNSEQEKRRGKERLLNEIIEWALDTAKSAIDRQTREAHELWRTKLNYKFHRTKSKYLAEIAVSYFANLSSFIEDINAEFDEALDVTTRCISAMHIEGLLGNDEAQRLRESEDIARAIENLIEETAKIKTKDN